ncbi:MAG: YgiQ family radical SAM protein [Spirochaetales bacterium]|nr:YgiQ family radical SAM protein [Spirochaetales bacterium]
MVMFLPTTKEECERLGWKNLDVIIITGDTYIDTPFSGVAVIGRVLVDAGYKTGIIAQPDINGPVDVTRLGEPLLFWGITGGCMDSLVANYTATRKFRNSDDLTPGGVNNRRPDRAVIVYTNLVRRFFKNTVPIVLGGLEASLRRITHYDYWSHKVRNSILFDAKGDLLIYGMGEKTVLEIAVCLRNKKDFRKIKGLCFISNQLEKGYDLLPGAEEVKQDKAKFLEMFKLFYRHATTHGSPGMIQQHGERYLVHNPLQDIPTTAELDHFYSLPYEYDAHPFYKSKGIIRALDTIRFSITTHRGCCGDCHFCAISVHQGKVVASRSEASIVKEARRLSRLKGFKGYITDVGGATANMYHLGCSVHEHAGMCPEKSCLSPVACRNLKFPHKSEIDLLNTLQSIPGIKKVFIASGIRYDLIVADKEYGKLYLKALLAHHTSGQLKIAPEHTSDYICGLMNKPGVQPLVTFVKMFDAEQSKLKSKQYLTYYFIAAHPGCRLKDMKDVRRFIEKNLKIHPEQVQIFTPVPSTWSTAMYYTEIDPNTNENLYVEKDMKMKEIQKNCIIY